MSKKHFGHFKLTKHQQEWNFLKNHVQYQKILINGWHFIEMELRTVFYQEHIFKQTKHLNILFFQ